MVNIMIVAQTDFSSTVEALDFMSSFLYIDVLFIWLADMVD